MPPDPAASGVLLSVVRIAAVVREVVADERDALVDPIVFRDGRALRRTH